MIKAIEDESTQEFALAALRQVEDLMPSINELGDNYKRAIALLSAEDPILAFRMRHLDGSMDRVEALPETLVDFVRTSDEQALLSDMMTGTQIKVVEVLRDAIVELALQHGLVTWIRVRRLLRNELEVLDLYEEMSDLLPEPSRGKFKAELERVQARIGPSGRR